VANHSFPLSPYDLFPMAPRARAARSWCRCEREDRLLSSRCGLAGSRDACPWPGRFDQKVEIQVTLAMISASVGKRPMICLEQAIRSSTLISKTPPPERCRVTCASGRTLLMSFAAARARGS